MLKLKEKTVGCYIPTQWAIYRTDLLLLCVCFTIAQDVGGREIWGTEKPTARLPTKADHRRGWAGGSFTSW